MRLIQHIKQKYPLLTSKQCEEAIQAGFVQIEGLPQKKVKKGLHIKEPHLIRTTQIDTQIEEVKKGTHIPDVRVIQATPEYLLIYKPAGIYSQPLSLNETQTLTHWLWSERPESLSEFDSPFSEVVPHRLDRDTSGIMMVCLNYRSYLEWRQIFGEHQMTKTYYAWCWGSPRHDQYDIAPALTYETHQPIKMRVSLDKSEEPRFKAKSHAQIIIRNPTTSLVKVTCQTGTTHQVRVHMASIGHPLMGDQLYDPKFDQREDNFSHHQLLAVSLKTKNFHAQLTEDIVSQFSLKTRK